MSLTVESIVVINNAGGLVYSLNEYNHYARFLILGSSGSTYYCTKEMMFDESLVLLRTIFGGTDVALALKCLDLTANVLKEGRSPKRDPSLFSLAIASHASALEVRKHAWKVALEQISIPTDYFKYITFAMKYNLTNEKKRGWGTGFKKSVIAWILKQRDGSDMLRLFTKYESRDGMSMRDLIRLAHINGSSLSVDKQIVIAYLVYGFKNKFSTNSLFKAKGLGLGSYDLITALKGQQLSEDTIRTIALHEAIQELKTPPGDGKWDLKNVVSLIYKFNLPRENLSTELLNEKVVWEALLMSEDKMTIIMGLTALTRNLAKMTILGLFDNLNTLNLTSLALTNSLYLKKSRMHPLQFVTALYTYRQGQGTKGSLTWTPNTAIMYALETAIVLSFKFVKATGKRVLHAMDVSGSMTSKMLNSPLSCIDASAIIVKSYLETETIGTQQVVAFQDVMVPLFTKNETNSIIVNANCKKNKVFNSLDETKAIHEYINSLNITDFVKKTSGIPFGNTDCAQPMIWALEQKVAIDCFIVYTDSETHCGQISATDALKKYRKEMGIEAKMVVIGMTASKFTIADPTDKNSLDVVGFDTGIPNLLSNFVMDE